MKKIIKLTILLMVFLFSFTFTTTSVNAIEAGETYLIGKDGNKVYHYGTGAPVTIPTDYLTAEYEMRGVWVATVYNIAIGAQKGTSEEAINNYKKEFISILDRMSEYNLNTLFFQVRPSNDAFYKSELNTWSQFLAGAGVDPGWDPLEWMVAETHKRGFAFQCWMNAFRVTVYSVLPDSTQLAGHYTNEELISFKNKALSMLADGNFAKEHPEYVVMGESDTRLILNPSEPAVQDFVVSTVLEIAKNYDVDGMHFDDYFYLSGSISSNTFNSNFAGGTTYNPTLVGAKILNDLPNYEEYKAGNAKYAGMESGMTLGDFRRESLNRMIRKIRAGIDKYNLKNNNNTEFGAKPAGVWRSNIEFCETDKERCTSNGSNTAPNSYTSYNDLYADSLKWVEEGLVDYMAPQIYYSFGDKYSPYADVVDFWAREIDRINAEHVKNGKKEVKLYIAHGIYKYRDNPDQFNWSAEIRNQLKYNQKYDCIKGSAFYSYENLYVFQGSSAKTLEQAMTFLKNTFKQDVLPIAVGTNDAANIHIGDYTVGHNLLNESYTITLDKIPNVSVYALYQVAKGETLDISKVETRKLVEYAGYTENEKLNLRLYDYDENSDYYLKVLSKNYFMADETVKIDFSKAFDYKSIEVTNITQLSDVEPLSKALKVTVDTKYLDDATLTYTAYLDESGSLRRLASGNVVNNQIVFEWKTYAVETTGLRFKVVLTDGEIEIEQYTNTFDIGSLSYNISYNLDGGILEPGSPSSYDNATGLSNLPTPNKEGYRFVGWKLNNVTVTSILANTSSDVTLTAVWEKQDVISNITYNLDGGKLSFDPPTTYIEGIGLNSLPTPSKDDNNFLGWAINGKMVESITSTDTGDITLTATWEQVKKKGCKKSSAELFISTLSLLSLALIVIKRKH